MFKILLYLEFDYRKSHTIKGGIMLKQIYAAKCSNNHKHPQIHSQDSLHFTFTLVVLRGASFDSPDPLGVSSDSPGPLSAGSSSAYPLVAGSSHPTPRSRALARPTLRSQAPSRPTLWSWALAHPALWWQPRLARPQGCRPHLV